MTIIKNKFNDIIIVEDDKLSMKELLEKAIKDGVNLSGAKFTLFQIIKTLIDGTTEMNVLIDETTVFWGSNPIEQLNFFENFEKKYKELRDAQRSLFKTNFLSQLRRIGSVALKAATILCHARDKPSSRTARALRLITDPQGDGLQEDDPPRYMGGPT